MNKNKYIANPTIQAITVDASTFAVISSKKRFCIKGTGMAAAIHDIISHFKAPAALEEVLSYLSKRYSATSLQKLFTLLIDRDILIDEHEYTMISKYNEAFLEESFYYTLFGKPLEDVVGELDSLRIGIIGTNQFVRLLMDCFARGSLLSNFIIGILDGKLSDYDNTTNMNIVNHSLHQDLSILKTIIKESDIVIAASLYHDHFLFNKINDYCIKENKKWLRVVVDGANAEVGPLFVPGETCCYSCLQTRRRQNLSSEEYTFDDLYESVQFHEDSKKNTISFSSFYPLSSMAAGIAHSELMKHFVGMKCNLPNQVLLMDGLQFQTRIDYVYKDYICAACSRKEVANL